MNCIGKIVEFGKSCSNKFDTKHDNFDERGEWDGGIDTNVCVCDHINAMNQWREYSWILHLRTFIQIDFKLATMYLSVWSV